MLTIIRCLSFAFILGGSFYFGRLGQSVETVQITDRGNSVARLVPLEVGTKEFDES